MTFEIYDKVLIELNKVDWFTKEPLYAWGFKEVIIRKKLKDNQYIVLFEDNGGKEKYYGIAYKDDLKKETKSKRKFFKHMGLKFVKVDNYEDIYMVEFLSEKFSFEVVVDRDINTEWIAVIVIRSLNDKCSGELEVEGETCKTRKKAVDMAVQTLENVSKDLSYEFGNCWNNIP